MNRRLVVGFLAVLIGSAVLTLPVSAQETADKEVVAVGMADGKDARARDEAISDALRQAVAQGVGAFISTETLTENMVLVQDRIYSESQGYIASYRILKEGVKDGIFQVQVSAVVKMGKLAGDLESIGLLISKKQNPRVMVVVFSKEVSDTFFGTAEEGNRNTLNQIERELLAKGFQIVDAGMVQRKKKVEALLTGQDPSRAARLAKDFGAEVLVEANLRRKFSYEKVIMGRPMRFFSNEIGLRAYETESAKVLYSGFQNRPPSGENALLQLEEAATELTEEMIAGILDQWRKDVFQAGTFRIDIGGASFADLSAIKEGLRGIRGLKEVQVRSFQGGRADLEVKFQGTAEDLAEKVGALKKPGLRVTGLQANSLEAVVSR